MGFFLRECGLLPSFVLEEIEPGWPFAFAVDKIPGFFQRSHIPPGVTRVAVQQLGQLIEGFAGSLFQQPD